MEIHHVSSLADPCNTTEQYEQEQVPLGARSWTCSKLGSSILGSHCLRSAKFCFAVFSIVPAVTAKQRLGRSEKLALVCCRLWPLSAVRHDLSHRLAKSLLVCLFSGLPASTFAFCQSHRTAPGCNSPDRIWPSGQPHSRNATAPDYLTPAGHHSKCLHVELAAASGDMTLRNTCQVTTTKE